MRKAYREKCGNDNGCTYKSPSIIASNGHKELKMVQNDIQDNCLFVYVQINLSCDFN